MVSWVGHGSQCQGWQGCGEQALQELACLRAGHEMLSQKHLGAHRTPNPGTAGTQPE